MANLEEEVEYEAAIYQLETTDAVVGGLAGISNLQSRQLANRTAWLKAQAEAQKNGGSNYIADTGVTNALVADFAASFAAYTEGMQLRVKVAATNTAASTLSLDGMAAKAIKKCGVAALEAGDLVVGDIITLVYDGAAFQLQTPARGLRLGKNLLIGGNFSTNPYQRGTASLAVTVSGTFVADRFRVEFDGAPTITRDVVNVAVGSKVLGLTVRRALKLTITAKGGATYIRLGQRVESVDSLAGDSSVLSSAIQGNKAIDVPIRVVQCFGTGGAPSANVITAAAQTLSVTANMAELYADLAVPALTGKTYGTASDYLELQYDLSALATGDYVIIPLAQLEKGSSPTPIERVDVATERPRFHRYYETGGVVQMIAGPVGVAVKAFIIPFQGTKRVVPTMLVYDDQDTPGKCTTVNDGGSGQVANTTVLLTAGLTACQISATTGAGASGIMIKRWSAESEL